MSKDKLLMIVNEFPPTGASSVQRPLKFAKYAVKAGWEVHIIAPKKPVRKVLDYSLLQEIPPESKVYRVAGLGIKNPEENKMVDANFEDTAPQSKIIKAFWRFLKLINDFLFPYDKQIGWMPFAYWKTVKLINKYKIRNIYITAYPYSAFLVGIALKKKYKDSIFWIADYRDSWQFGPLLDKMVLPFRFKKICRTDDRVLVTCDAAVFVTPESRNIYLHKHPWLDKKSYYIPNGYDEDDFEGVIPKKFDCLTFVYMGKLTRVYGNPISLLEALKECNLPKYQVIHIGSISAAFLQDIQRIDKGVYKFCGYKNHREAISYILGADINLIFLNDDPISTFSFTGKLFELLRAGKPILAMGPKKCIIEDLLKETGAGKYAWIKDKDQIKMKINELLTDTSSFSIQTDIIKQYSRAETCKTLLSIYERGQISNS